MAIPDNQTAATAMVITALPFTVTQDVADQTSTLQLWYVYTGQTDDRMLGCVPYADNSGLYRPKLYVYTGTPASLTAFKIFGSQQRACEIPIEPGTNYYFKVTQGGATSPLGQSLTFRADRPPQTDAPIDSIIAAEENRNMRTPVLSSVTDNLVHYYIDDINFMISAIGTTLAGGNLIGDGDLDSADALTIYDKDLVQVYRGVPSYFGYGPTYITSDTTKFYLQYQGATINDLTIRTLTSTGAETTDVWAPTNGRKGRPGSPNQTGTIYYYATLTAEIRRWDLVNDTALSDLAPAIANYTPRSDLLVLADGTILVCYTRPAIPDQFVKHYSAAGAVLHTYNFGVSNVDHMALSYSNPLSFWVWMHTESETRSVYRQILVSDGSTITESQFDMFTNGPSAVGYDPEYATAAEVPLFGPAPSCTFFVTTAAVTPEPTPITPDFEIVEDPRRWLRRAPIVSTQNRRVIHDLFCLDIEPGVGQASGSDYNTDPQVMMRWSDSAGKTWSNELWRSMGRIGQYKTRLEWWRLGDSRFRVYEVSGNAAVKTVLLGGFAQVRATTDAPQD